MIPGSRTVVATLLALAWLGCSGCEEPASPPTSQPPARRPSLDPTYRASGHMAAGDVFVHLFEWKWTDIASECENVLGPLGYRAVQVSPPQEHILQPGFPWWQRYQPVSYSIERNRSGSGAEFTQMVQRCRTAGVDIYVDAVINHMTAGSGTGSNGTVYTKYNYPGLHTQSDSHSPCTVNNYQSPANVQDCELLGLADLHTGRSEVRQRIADYLIGLVRVGFRSAVAGTGVNDWWDNGASAIAFSRGDRGFVALKLEAGTVTIDVATPLPAGTYCDALTGGPVGAACAGRSVDVSASGRVQLDLEAGAAVALHVGTRL